MKVTIHQPAFMPWLGLMSKIQQSDIYVCLDHVQYSKNSFDNRNRILVKEEPTWLTIPVQTKGKFKNNPLNKAEVAKDFRQHHLNLLKHGYGKADTPFAKQVLSLYKVKSNALFDYSDISMRILRQNLQIDTPVLYSSGMNLKSKGSDMIYDICKKLDATEYLSGPMGKDYLDEKKFKEGGIKVLYHYWNSDYFLSSLHYMLKLGIPKTQELLRDEYTIED